jgi:hypothetical protein
MEWGSIIFVFSFFANPTFFIFCFFICLVLIQISPMFINNVFFHTHDAMHKVVKIYIFFGLCRVDVVIRSLNHGVAQYAPHVLDVLHLNLCRWIIQHKKCPNKGDKTMRIPKCLVIIQLSTQNTPCFLLNIDPLIIPLVIAFTTSCVSTPWIYLLVVHLPHEMLHNQCQCKH